MKYNGRFPQDPSWVDEKPEPKLLAAPDMTENERRHPVPDGITVGQCAEFVRAAPEVLPNTDSPDYIITHDEFYILGLKYVVRDDLTAVCLGSGR